jgi:hypothetical protein
MVAYLPRTVERHFREFAGACYPYIPGAYPLGTVGWGQDEYGEWPNEIACMATVWQFAVQFDRGPLDQVPSKTVDRALLSYGEARAPGCLGLAYGGIQFELFPCWRNGDGDAEDKPIGCVDVRVPSADWPNTAPPNGLIPSLPGPSPAVTRLATQRVEAPPPTLVNEWDVSEPFRWQYDPSSIPIQPEGGAATAGYGLLLTGWPTNMDQLTGDDDTICVSQLSNIRLLVTYTVPPDAGQPDPIR